MDSELRTAIEELRTEAAAAGDMAQAELCDSALAGNIRARAACVRAIRSARDGEEKPWDTMSADHLGSEATAEELAEYRRLADAASGRYPLRSYAAIDAALWCGGDYLRGARRLGVLGRVGVDG